MNSVTINLNSPHYEQFVYPAGETQVRLTNLSATTADHVRVIARIRHGEDIVRLALLKSAIGHSPDVDLILPYLPYSRADRRFTDGDCCGLEAFGSLINSMGFSRIVTIDAHNSSAAKRFINNLADRSAMPAIVRAIVEFSRRRQAKRVTILFPDKGARERYHIPPIEGNQGRVEFDVLHCDKRRNPSTGALEGFDVPPLDRSQPALIVDDICDGGGTFIGIAKSVPDDISIGLYVTHGIFSKGLDPLSMFGRNIFTTNTFQDRPSIDPLTVLDAMPILLSGN